MLVEQNLPEEDVISYIYRKKRKFNLLYFLRTIILFLTVVVLLTLYLNYHIQVMGIGYKLQTLEKELKKIKNENDLLQISFAKYVSMEHVDNIAVEKLKMQRPQYIEFIKIKKAQP